jgi:hypothetical protein
MLMNFFHLVKRTKRSTCQLIWEFWKFVNSNWLLMKLANMKRLFKVNIIVKLPWLSHLYFHAHCKCDSTRKTANEKKTFGSALWVSYQRYWPLPIARSQRKPMGQPVPDDNWTGRPTPMTSCDETFPVRPTSIGFHWSWRDGQSSDVGKIRPGDMSNDYCSSQVSVFTDETTC